MRNDEIEKIAAENNKFLLHCSERADKVFEQAESLVKSLDDAEEAQEKAKTAIHQAHEDIALAKADLEKVHRSH